MTSTNIIKNITYTTPRNQNEIYSHFSEIINNNYEILAKEKLESSFRYEINFNNTSFDIIAHIGRIHDNGFPGDIKPEIKRIQVRPIKEETVTGPRCCFLLGGIAKYLDEPILVVWNPFSFVGFEKNRSAYVEVSSLKEAYDNGYYFGTNSGTNIYICRKSYFDILLNKYISDTKFEGLECQF